MGDILTISALRLDNNVMGYRLEKSDRGIDFSTDLLDDITKEAVTCGYKWNLGVDYEGSVMDGKYITQEEIIQTNKTITEVETIDGFKQFMTYCSNCYVGEFTDTMLMRRFLICRQMLYDIGVPVGNVNILYINSRLSRSWGRCVVKAINRRLPWENRCYTIEISSKLMQGVESSDGLDLVIMHELLHTCPNCMNHGSEWKKWGRLVCSAYGYDIQRLTSAEELKVSSEELIEQGYYACQCQGCGMVITKKTECKFIKHPNWYECSKCGGRFTRIA